MSKKTNNRKPVFEWDSENGVATCTMTDGENFFIGTAICHPEDEDMMSEKTGMIIAESRAIMDYCRHLRDNEIKPELKALKQLYYSINTSKYFNPKHHEVRTLLKHIELKEEELQMIKLELHKQKKYLTNYIKDKDEFYKHVRANRKKGENN